MEPEYIVLIVGALISFTGVLFKTTKDSSDKNSVIKWPNRVGWLVLVLMITSFFITLYLKDQDKAREKMASELRKNKEIRDSANFENKRIKDSTAQATSLAYTNALLNKSDSITFLTKALSKQQIELTGQQLEHTRELMLSSKYPQLRGIFVLRLHSLQEQLLREEHDDYNFAKSKDTNIVYEQYLYAKTRTLLFPEFKYLSEVGAGIDINYGSFWQSHFSFYTNGRITSGNEYRPNIGPQYVRPLGANTFSVRENELMFAVNFEQKDTVNAMLLYKLIRSNQLTVKMNSRIKTVHGKQQTLATWEQMIKDAYFLVALSERSDIVAKIPLRIQSTSANTVNPKAEITWVQAGKPVL